LRKRKLKEGGVRFDLVNWLGSVRAFFSSIYILLKCLNSSSRVQIDAYTCILNFSKKAGHSSFFLWEYYAKYMLRNSKLQKKKNENLAGLKKFTKIQGLTLVRKFKKKTIFIYIFRKINKNKLY
jgi:hypothetical protein